MRLERKSLWNDVEKKSYNVKLTVARGKSEFAPLISLEQECAHLPSFSVNAYGLPERA